MNVKTFTSPSYSPRVTSLTFSNLFLSSPRSSPASSVSSSTTTTTTTTTTHKGKKSHGKRKKSKRESEEDRLIREAEEEEAKMLKEEAEEEERMRARKTAFRRTTVAKAVGEVGEDMEWERFTKRHENKKAEDREKKAFFEMMKNSPDRMHSKKRATLLGGFREGADHDHADLESDDEWEAVPDEAYEELMKKEYDPLDRIKVKQHTFKALHSEDNDKMYYAGRRGKEVRTKVRGKTYLLKEKGKHDDFVRRETMKAGSLEGLLGAAVVFEEEEEEEEGEEKKVEGEEVAVGLTSPEKVSLPKIG